MAVVLAVIGGVIASPSIAEAAGPTTFSNTTSIAIPATGSANQTGPASPYPSGITVSGMAGTVSAVQVVFHSLTHGALNDVDAMVVAPSGENLVVLSDIGDPNQLATASNATLTFDDTAGGTVPAQVVVPTGSYRPTNTGGADTFPAPAPAPSTQTTLSGAFTGINPNGTWQLFIVDDATGDIGSMAGGWSLVITTAEAAVATATTVTSSGSPATTGAAVTFTATVTASGSPVTSGSVAFTADGGALATVPVNASGVAQFTTSALAEGTHLIVGTYSGSTGFLTSNGSVSQQVDNQTVVTGSTYCNTGAFTIPSSGPAVPYPSNITVSGLTAPVTKVTATLNGVSHAVPVDLDVMLSSPVPSTNLMLLSDVGGTAAVSGATVVFDDAAPGGVPTPLTSGTFRATDDDSDVADAAFPAPAPIVSSATTLATFNGASGNGVWSLWVVDDAGGDSGSISGGWCLTFTTASPTTTALTSSVNPSTVGQAVTFTATVTANGSPVTTGTVTFTDGATIIAGNVPVDATGTATVTTSSLTTGTHPITATYDGTPALTSSSDSVDQVVNLTPTATTVTSSVNPSTVGQAVTFTATVTANGSPVTTGTVTFTDGATIIAGNVPVDATGTATVTTSSLTTGTHPITATYDGTPALTSSSDSVDQVVLSPVVADAGEPYSVAEGDPLTLDGSGSTPGATYEWDLDGNGVFDDATGMTPTLTWTQLAAVGVDDGPSTGTVSLRVTLGLQVSTASAVLSVTNTAPETIVTGTLTATVGVPLTLKIGADDPSSADMTADFVYTIDWGDGSPIETIIGPADPPVTHTYTAPGTYVASFTSTDKDGGTGAPTTVQVLAAAAPLPLPTPTPMPSPLPPTGTDPAGPMFIGGVLLLLGLTMITAARRRARRG